ncbi:large subunit GTPase 1 homolog [Nephila pilipes]|uniref:Large subunit GTPase 1 homolog n=1 Tax=Nephila pilipes TaxID=299642 RepID=A0A8X6QFB5_NEPPI|nr:large subunit GTPase 1 homolog [Nephila pilipes]
MPKNNNFGLGRALIKAHKRKGKFVAHDNYRHVSDLPDGRDFGRLNLTSVTEQTALNEFLDTAALAEKDFLSEMNNVKIIDPDVSNGLLTDEEIAALSLMHEENKEILCIPRRPHWDLRNMTKEEIDANEREAFLNWRRNLARVQEAKNINLTPFEKNLEIWRQLWRVIERSDVVLQIIDARNPHLFRCHDLEKYVKEVDGKKINILLLNKADLLTESERKCWCDYFDVNKMKIVFFSALQEGNRPPEDLETTDSENLDKNNSLIEKNSSDVLSREQLIQFFKQILSETPKTNNHVPTVGLIGYPNVGKSSTLNALLMTKKACVSATPGKTKHFQTFLIDSELCLCDCPGLVFPNFVSTKAEMVINGFFYVAGKQELFFEIFVLLYAVLVNLMEIMDGIDNENTFLLDDELHSDTDTDISSNYLDYSSDDSCSELNSDEDLSSSFFSSPLGIYIIL